MTNTADQTNVADLSALADELRIVRHADPPPPGEHLRRGRWAAVRRALTDADPGEWIAVERLTDKDAIRCQASLAQRRGDRRVETRSAKEADGTYTLWLRIKP